MKIFLRSLIPLMSTLIAASAFAANPYLDAKDDKPVSANFRGEEWNDENINGEIPLAARVITTRVAQMPWGAIFKIEFVDLKSRAKQKREIGPLYFIATDDRIVLFDASAYVQVESGTMTTEQAEKYNADAIKKISAMEKPPDFEQGDIRAINSGKMNFEEGPYTTEIAVKGDQCTYTTSHNSGHYTKFVWKKGAGLIDHRSNYGAAKDGYRLIRVGSKK
ncbi:MAG TPA: hypothetical protein VJ281_02315 [Chthoniobacterales bacterium]|jgi:hypothetical protein|nr:hypothetical protein [Chthoniobacterales bacterium]